MKRIHILGLAGMVSSGGCDLLSPGPTPTTVSGIVFEDGVPVAAVDVGLRQAVPITFGGPVGWAGFTTTDAEGRYSLTEDVDSRQVEGCPVRGVDVTPGSRAERRLTNVSGSSEQAVECGESQSVDFHFSTNVWYHGAMLTVNGQANADTIEVLAGESISVRATFRASASASGGGLHRDSLPGWVWYGQRDWLWDDSEGPLSFPSGYYEPDDFSIAVRGPGVATIIARLAGSPFADTVTVVATSPSSSRRP